MLLALENNTIGHNSVENYKTRKQNVNSRIKYQQSAEPISVFRGEANFAF